MSSAPTRRQAASGSEYASIARTAMRCHLANTSSAVRKALLSTGNTLIMNTSGSRSPSSAIRMPAL